MRAMLFASMVDNKDNKPNNNLIVQEIIKHGDKKITFRIVSHVILKDNDGYTHLLEHIVICNNGIFVISPLSQKGDITINVADRFWKEIDEGKENNINNPYILANINARYLEQYFNEEYHIKPVVVFLRNNNKDKKIPSIINLNELGAYLSTYKNEYVLDKTTVTMLYKRLLSYIKIQPSIDEHINNTKKYYSAIEKKHCPYCDNDLIEKDEHLYCPSCSKYVY